MEFKLERRRIGILFAYFIDGLWELPREVIAVSFSLMIYPILILQLAFGFPPFYASTIKFGPFSTQALERSEELKFRDLCFFNIRLLILFAVIVFLVEVTDIRGFYIFIGVGAISSGRYIRRMVAENKNGPLGYCFSFISQGRPMLVFDIWSIGLFLLIFVSRVFD